MRKISPGINDSKVLEIAKNKHAILITSDKDFGELVVIENLAHEGVVLLRLKQDRSLDKINALRFLLAQNIELEDKFTVISEAKNGYKIRVRKI